MQCLMCLEAVQENRIPKDLAALFCDILVNWYIDAGNNRTTLDNVRVSQLVLFSAL
jgi:hypothetical protein